MDRAGQREQRALGKPAAAEILEPLHLSLQVAKLRDGNIQPPVAIEIGGLNIRDAIRLFEHHLMGETTATVVAQDDHGADLVVVREDHAHRGHEHVEVTVAIEVDD
jgi:hypothetical protein